jgi:hypothetical protein
MVLNGRFMHKIERITVENVYIGYRQLTWHFTAYLQGRLRTERGVWMVWYKYLRLQRA